MRFHCSSLITFMLTGLLCSRFGVLRWEEMRWGESPISFALMLLKETPFLLRGYLSLLPEHMTQRNPDMFSDIRPATAYPHMFIREFHWGLRSLVKRIGRENYLKYGVENSTTLWRTNRILDSIAWCTEPFNIFTCKWMQMELKPHFLKDEPIWLEITNENEFS